MHEDWVPLQIPDTFDEMMEGWSASRKDSVGFCLLCGSPIRTESEFISGTNTHNCEAGRAMEAEISAKESSQGQASKSRRCRS